MAATRRPATYPRLDRITAPGEGQARYEIKLGTDCGDLAKEVSPLSSGFVIFVLGGGRIVLIGIGCLVEVE